MGQMLKYIYCLSIIVVVISFTRTQSASGQEISKSKFDKMAKTGGSQAYDPERYNLLNINNLTSWHRNDGLSNHSTGGDNGVYYPRGTASPIYEDGLMWGARAFVDVNKTVPAPYGQIIRVGGSTYGTNATAGPVIGFGANAVPAGDGHPQARIYRIRRDWKEMTDDELRRDAAESNEIGLSSATQAQIDAIIDDYRFSWENWPVEIGAPFIDRNGNGIYDPPPPDASAQSLIDNQYDEPGIAGVDPDTPADQVLWCVWNDLNRTKVGLFGSEPMGLEVQMTLWGYKRNDVVGNMYFKRWKIINKGGVEINNAGTRGSLYLDSMYVSQWADPDLGIFGDDLVGCDLERSMGFVYNGNVVDQEYRKLNLPPPAVGYDLLQGPVVESPGDIAVFDLKNRIGFKNMGMTAFSYFSAGSPYSDPGGGYATNTILWDKMLRGFAPLVGEDVRYTYPPGVDEGPFPLNGDPLKQSGFIDGLDVDYSFPPGDRRFLITSGPFALAPSDTQEIVVSFVAGLGADRLSSISVMKYNDTIAQSIYDARFAIPDDPVPPFPGTYPVQVAPVAPDVRVQELDSRIILEWGSPVGVAATENTVLMPGSYIFEGYNVYQFPDASASLKEAKRVATFDIINDKTLIKDSVFDTTLGYFQLIPVQFGSNSGVERVYTFDRDYLNNQSSVVNGTGYFLGVTAYNVSSEENGIIPKVVESPVKIIKATPARIDPGNNNLVPFDTLDTVVHSVGNSSGAVYPVVIDPSALTGDSYRVTFTDMNSDGETEFNLENITTNEMLIVGNTNQSGDSDYLITEGFQARVVDAAFGFKTFSAIANAAGPIDPPTGAAADFMNFPIPLREGGTPDRPGATQQVGAGKWMIATGGQYDFYEKFLDRTTQGGKRWKNIVPYDYEWRFTAAGGYALLAYTNFKVVKVPFELWRIGSNTPDDPSDDVRMIPFVFDEDGNGQFNLQAKDHPLSGNTNDPYTDWVYWTTPLNDAPGETGYYAWETAVLALSDSIDTDRATSNLHTNENNMQHMVLVNWNGGDVAAVPPRFNQDMPETGTIFRIETKDTKPNSIDDVFEFKTIRTIDEGEIYTTGKIGVFPNPYDRGELNLPDPFVTFINLPRKATLRIFNLAGQLVRKLEKNDDTQFLRWDLRNFSRLPVASGVYVVHIELPDLDTLKTLKLTVIL